MSNVVERAREQLDLAQASPVKSCDRVAVAQVYATLAIAEAIEGLSASIDRAVVELAALPIKDGRLMIDVQGEL